MNWKQGLLFVFSLSCFQVSNAQLMDEETGIMTENGYKRYITAGVGAVYQSFYDDAISKYNYQKIGFSPSIGHLKINEVTFSEFYMQGSMLKFNRGKGTSNSLSVSTARALLDYRFLVRAPFNFLGFDMRGGGMLSGMYGNKKAPHLYSSSDIHEYAASFGLTIRIARESYFKKKPVIISWDFSIPLITNFSRPTYLNRVENLDPDNQEWKDFIENSVTKSIGGYLRYNSRLNYTYLLDNGNAVRLSYIWDYTRLKHNKIAYFAEHTVMLAFLLNH